MNDHQRLREWSAAYVLGALEAPERAEFEAHLAECSECQEDVASFAPIPGLLSRIEPDGLESAPERIADRAVERVHSEWSSVVRSRRRWQWVAAVAAMAATFTIVLSTFGGSGSDSLVLALEPGSLATGEIAVEAKAWGTAVAIEVGDLPPRDRYVAWVVTEDGTWQQAATWGPTPGSSASVLGASSIPFDEVDLVVIASADKNDTIASAQVSDA